MTQPMSEKHEALTQQDIKDEKGDLLPDREVMSLISTSPSAPIMPGVQPIGADGAADGAHDAANDAPSSAHDTTSLTGTDADGSVSESDASSVADDRSETFTSSDSAVSET
ncbi:MAG: hypothetical protein QOK47_917 [Actinomycetota bacterium]|nr:hypothetical protein [Actinomycetota bacterium]